MAMRASRSSTTTMLAVLLVVLVAALGTGCRHTLLYVSPERPQQGDLVWIAIDNYVREEVAGVQATWDGGGGFGDAVPAWFPFETCKDSYPYRTEIDFQAETTYRDGGRGAAEVHVELTRGLAANEDEDLTFGLYVTQDTDGTYQDQAIEMADAFIDELDTYSNSQYAYAVPAFYTTNSADYVNSVDLAISFGHGNHHTFSTGVGSVDLSTTAYGNFRPCGGHGDAEYVAFFSCLTLSLADSDGHPWHEFWWNDDATREQLRPFTGLHMAMGFRTDIRTICFFGCDGEDMMETFAANLDAGDRVLDAWQEAVNDELSFSSGLNRGIVVYLPVYEDDTLTSASDDYIHGSPHYLVQADYWD